MIYDSPLPMAHYYHGDRIGFAAFSLRTGEPAHFTISWPILARNIATGNFKLHAADRSCNLLKTVKRNNAIATQLSELVD